VDVRLVCVWARWTGFLTYRIQKSPVKQCRWESQTEHDEQSLNQLDGLKSSSRKDRSPSPDVMEQIKLMNQKNKNDGKKHVHWADLVERENALKRQKIGFHIGGGWNQELPELYSATRDNT